MTYMKLQEEYKSMIEDINRCCGCQTKPCGQGCPLDMPIPTILYSLKKENIDRVCELVYKNNPYPQLTNVLCDDDRQCKGHCIHAHRAGGIEFKNVEKFVSSKTDKITDFCGDIKEKVCIIGAGPSGISAAKILLKHGFLVTIIEKESMIGGAVYTGVPKYRFSSESLMTIQNELIEMGCKFEFNREVNSYAELKSIARRYNYVLVGIGATKERMLFEDHKNVIGGLKFLRGYNVNNTLGDLTNKTDVFVMGGGNVAFDCARVLKQHLPNVSIVYRRSIEEMPASQHEIAKAKSEGVELKFLENIIDVNSDGDKLSVTTKKNKLGEKDSSGRRRPIPIDGSETVYSIDAVVMAIGETPDFKCFENKLKIKEDGSTNLKRVRVMGDCLYGARTVAKAIGNGRDEANRIIDINKEKYHE